MTSTLSISKVDVPWMKYLAAGTAIFVGYAIYTDRKRRLDPEYKQKIRQNRKLKQAKLYSANIDDGVDFPDPRDQQATESFFFNQITLGEEKMQSGNTDEGITHLSNAVVTCGQPAELLKIFQQTFPPDHFNQLVQAIPAAKLRQQASIRQTYPKMDDAQTNEAGEDENGTGNKKMFLLQDDELE